MQLPDQSFSARELFGLETDLRVNGFASGMDLVPPVDPAYQFQPEVTQAILAGFMRGAPTVPPMNPPALTSK